MPRAGRTGVEAGFLGAGMRVEDEKMTERTQFPAAAGFEGVAFIAAAACLIWLAGGRPALAEEPKLEPAVVVRAIQPERQAAAVIDLFAGSRAANPAAALAAWRRATGNHDAIGKPLQAVAALFNPEMVSEWRAFDGARFDLAVEGARPGPLWALIAPKDDGALAALITSLRLSGGADEPPILDPPIAVERLGGPGAALAARLSSATVFASHRDMLAAEIQRFRAGMADPPATDLFKPDDSGFAITLRPDRIAVDERVAPGLARVATTARGLGLVVTDGWFGLEADRLELELVSRFQSEGEGGADVKAPSELDPAWLAWFPERESAAAVAVVLGPGAEFWDGLFQVADAIDRAAPARAELAPLRSRLTFLALARGVRLEADLWPLLRGASAGLLVEDGLMGRPRGIVVALHAADPQGARRILDRVVAPLAGAGRPKPVAEAAPGSEASPLVLGRVSGRPLEAVARGATVLVAWGEGALSRALQSAETPEKSVAALLDKETGDDRPVNRFGVIQAGRAALALGAWGPNSPFAAALVSASPVVWRGGWRDGLAWDSARWPNLRGLVARFLERIPQEPFEAP